MEEIAREEENPKIVMNRLIINAYNCWGCKTCEETCKRVHDDNVSRINVVVKSKRLRIPLTCLQCEDAACIMACKFNALTRNEETGAVERNQAKCTICYACLSACPFGNVILDKKTGHVIKCDLCRGDPECAKTCPSKTLVGRNC